MKELEKVKNVSKDGITIYLLKRVGDKALVVNYANSSTRSFGGFEVHIIKKQKEKDITLGGVKIHLEEAEKYRSAKQFGTKAWIYPTLDLVYEAHPEFKPFAVEIVDSNATVLTNTTKRS